MKKSYELGFFIFLLSLPFLTIGCIADIPNLLQITKVTVDNINIDLNKTDEVITNIGQDPIVTVTFSHEVNLSGVESKIELSQDVVGSPSIPISITSADGKTLRIILKDDTKLSKGITYMIRFLKGIEAQVDGTVYSLGNDLSIKFSTQLTSNDLELDIEYNENIIAAGSDGLKFIVPIAGDADASNVPLKLSVAPGAKIYHNDETAPLQLDFNNSITQAFNLGESNTVTLRIVAENKDEKTYSVVANLQNDNSKQIIGFEFGREINDFLRMDVAGSISGSNITVIVPAGVPINNLVPTITHTGQRVNPASEKAQDFTSEVAYIVTANDNSTHKYNVTVKTASSAVIYTVIFKSNNGSESLLQTVSLGDQAASPQNPIRSGYAFAGWFTDDNTFNRRYDFKDAVTKDITLYAKWISQKSHIVSISIFDSTYNFETQTISSVVLPYGIPSSIAPYSGLTLPTNARARDLNSSSSSSVFLESSGTLIIKNSNVTIEVIAEDNESTTIYAIEVILGTPKITLYTQSDVLGPAINDTELENFVIATVSGLNDAGYTVSFGSTSKVISVKDKSIVITKNDLKGNNANPDNKLTINYTGGTAESAIDIATYSPTSLFTWQDLQAMRLNLSANYTLMENIIFPELGESGFPETGFQPIGVDENIGSDQFQGNPFTGTLNGNQKTITNFAIQHENLSFAGLFGKIQAASPSTEVLKDVTFINPHTYAHAVAGTAVGWLAQGKIVNVGTSLTEGVHDTIKTIGSQKINQQDDNPYSYTGGLAGYVGASAELTSCYSQVSVVVSASYAGGLVGYNAGNVVGFSTGDCRGHAELGGLVGGNFGTVTGYATGHVNSKSNYVGGMVGLSAGKMVTGYATGNVLGVSQVGGLIGQLNSDSKATGYALGNVTGSGSNIGGLAGQNFGTLIGYARGYVFREGKSNDGFFGRLVGFNANGNVSGFFSGRNNESNLLKEGDEEGVYPIGTAIYVDQNTMRLVFERVDEDRVFIFDDEITPGPWVWITGKWPALNFGSSLLPDASQQPINPNNPSGF